MSRHRREPDGHLRAIAALETSATVRALAVLAFVLSAACAALGVAGVAGAGDAPDPCPPPTVSWHADPTPLDRGDPVAFSLDRVDACSSLAPVGVDARRRLEAPSVHTPEQAGWYRLGPTPGERGAAVIVGRMTGDGHRGVLAGVTDARTGDRLTVWRRDGTVAVFAVTGTTRVSTARFPTRAVYGNTDGAELRVVTAGEVPDGAGRTADDAVIVYAHLVGRG
ncbi:hypothetical protein Acsp06_01080 [Actinomycetospora sp. NBRC 106375]|uniref:sortase domain-containing protein n=1 Tax=Actinomycetospora sp. NBRC 106375 TaxID=3032207 RepID=UPI0024A0DACA|nr:sortase [Actinomycetospora sp. NBRC 106375]GLZ43923.1 hypothetical protein Acsp06_01080 [Actinomycetospora sp. NBRC 106375]